MPVRITYESNSSDPMVITKTDYETGRANFVAHYLLGGCDPNFYGQDMGISWDQLYNYVMSFIAQYSLDPSVVAVRFVHCYDTTTNSLYLRMQLCTMSQTATINEYSLNANPCAWYEIHDGSIMPTNDSDLIDNTYFNNICYCPLTTCDAQALQPLSSSIDSYVRNLTYPWQNEILAMYQDDGSPQGATICFGACSYVRPDEGANTVPYPHGLVMYLKNSAGIALLNDQDYISMFSYKGADYGTCCPPNCNEYIVPM